MAIVSALVMLLFGYVAYKQADRQGQWSWKLFGIIMAMVALFIFGFTVPLVSSKTLQDRHPGLLLTLLLVGIAVFVTIVILVARKLGKTMIPAAVAERADPGRSRQP
jgi:phosphoglycerol transferase MdoB-like AlkP superfamily enzyme